MAYKAIIFDLDGTIIDTCAVWDKVTHHIINSNGGEYTNELRELFHGQAMEKTCSIIKEHLGLQESIEALMKQKMALACSLYNEGIEFIPGFIDFHKKLQELNIKTAVATNADDGTFAIVKEVMKLSNFFGPHIYNIACVNYVCKPDPAIYLHAAKAIGIDPAHCIAIEDSAHGIRAAQAAGMLCIGINTSKNIEQVEKAEIVVDAYHEIPLEQLFS